MDSCAGTFIQVLPCEMLITMQVQGVSDKLVKADGNAPAWALHPESSRQTLDSTLVISKTSRAVAPCRHKLWSVAAQAACSIRTGSDEAQPRQSCNAGAL